MGAEENVAESLGVDLIGPYQCTGGRNLLFCARVQEIP